VGFTGRLHDVDLGEIVGGVRSAVVNALRDMKGVPQSVEEKIFAGYRFLVANPPKSDEDVQGLMMHGCPG
jgi:hypothetical protein